MRFIELCCGSAAVTTQLLGKGTPPVGYMGGKRAYADALLRCMQLPSDPVNALTLCDPGPWAHVWRVLPTHGVDLLAWWRRWENQDPRDLWRAVAAYAPLEAAHYSGPVTDHEIQDVAAWLFGIHGSFQNKGVSAGIGRPQGRAASDKVGAMRPSLAILQDAVRRLTATPWPPVTVYRDARAVPVPATAEDVWVYIDPPYAGTTEYAHALPRADVQELARRWSDAGALVAVSEGEPVDLPGWRVVEITDQRVGARRTFSKQQREFITVNL